MGMKDADVVPGLRVRHRDGWTGTIRRQGTPGVAEITPDGGSGPRWFYLVDFEPVDWQGGPLPERVPIGYATNPGSQVPMVFWGQARVPSATDAERRYMLDPGFHQLVAQLGQLLKLASHADLRQATDLAIRIDSDRRRATGDDVREREQTDAQKERGTHGESQPEPGGAGAQQVSGEKTAGGLPDHSGCTGHGQVPGDVRGGSPGGIRGATDPTVRPDVRGRHEDGTGQPCSSDWRR